MSTTRRMRFRGDVVERPVQPWTPTIQSLLGHLHAAGVPVPEPLGWDEHHERVRLLPGDAGQDAWPHQLDLAGVRSAGALLRRVHDATRDWTPPADAVWSAPVEPGAVVCHGDPQPANMAWRDGRAVGLFDWDAARPAPPVGDVAYALLWFVPVNADAEELRRRGLGDQPPRRARAEALLEGYGWTEPLDVVEVAAARFAQAVDEVELLGRRGTEPHVTWVAEGWPARWRAGVPAMRRTPLD